MCASRLMMPAVHEKGGMVYRICTANCMSVEACVRARLFARASMCGSMAQVRRDFLAYRQPCVI